MAIFSTSPPAYQAATPGTTATQVYSGTGVTVGATSYAFPAGGTLSNLTVQNSGTAEVYIGASSSVTTSTGLPLPAGMSVTFSGSVAVGTATAFNLWGITAAGTSQTEASLAAVEVAD